jgi:hypothetical protein
MMGFFCNECRRKLLEPSTEFEDVHGHEDETRTSTSGEDENEHGSAGESRHEEVGEEK